MSCRPERVLYKEVFVYCSAQFRLSPRHYPRIRIAFYLDIVVCCVWVCIYECVGGQTAPPLALFLHRLGRRLVDQALLIEEQKPILRCLVQPCPDHSFGDI